MNKLIKTILYLGALTLSLLMSGSNTVLARSTDKPIISTFRTYNTRDTLNIGGGAYVNMYGKTPYSPGAGSGPFYGPNGTYLKKDRGVNSGGGSHGGSYWKLFDRHANRIGTYDYDGNYLRP